MSKAKQKAGAASSETIQDISHEEVKHENGVSLIPKLVTPEDQIKLEIAKFNIAESGIAQLFQQFGELTIAGAEDKAGYKKVREAWREVQSTRTKLEKKGLELRNGYGVITKAIKKEEDRLVELISPLEDDLYGKWKAIDEEKDRVERERREAEEREAMARVEEVLGLGMVFRDGFYVVGDKISMDVATLRSLPLESYDKLKAAIVATVKFEADAAAFEAELKQREAEQLQREKDELARQQAEMKKAQEDLQRQKEELAQAQREAAKQKIENRIGKLVSLGMKERDFDVHYNNGFSVGFSIPLENISGFSDTEFSNVLIQMESEIKRVNIEKADHEEKVNQEKEAKAKKERFIADCMQKAGLNYEYNTKSFKFENEFFTTSLPMDELLAMSEDAILLRTDYEANQRINAIIKKTQVDKDREEAAAKEEKLAMGDNERFAKELAAIEIPILKMVPGEYKTKKYQNKAQALLEQLTKVLNASK